MEPLDAYVIGRYFQDTAYPLTRHHLESYHQFVFQALPQIIRTLNDKLVTVKTAKFPNDHRIHVMVGGPEGDRLYLSRPTIFENGTHRNLFPNEARLKNLHYMADLHADIVVEYSDASAGAAAKPTITTRTFPRVHIGSLPILVHSRLCVLHDQPPDVLRAAGECPYDQGGYFIVGGKEKVVIGQERTATNRLFVSESSHPDYTHEALIRSTTDTLFPKKLAFAIRSPDKAVRPRAILVKLPNLIDSQAIPLTVLFRALGIESDREILETIVGDLADPMNAPLLEALRPSIVDGHVVFTQAEAQAWMLRYIKGGDPATLQLILESDVLPHIPKEYRDKALVLGALTRQFVDVVVGRTLPTNRDNYMYKRIDVSGFLFINLFRDAYNELRNQIRDTVDRIYLEKEWGVHLANVLNEQNLVQRVIDRNIITNRFIRALKGDWGETVKADGVAQDLNRLSYLGYISHVRRVNNPLTSAAKMREPHRLVTSQWGYVCSAETPDGPNVGLIKHLSMLTRFSMGDIDSAPLLGLLKTLGMTPLVRVTRPTRTDVRILLNDVWLGTHRDPVTVYKRLLLYRRHGLLPGDMGLSWNVKEGEIRIRTDAGRCLRPLWIVRAGALMEPAEALQAPARTWASFFEPRKGAPATLAAAASLSLEELEATQASMEYVDCEETNGLLIAMWPRDIGPRTTHAELHPSTSLSFYTNTIPLPHHNPGPRNTFSGAQGKQAIGIYATNFPYRMDTAGYIQHYPQMSLVRTAYAEASHTDALPNGNNVIVAVASYMGYNQEDSVMINKSSVDRGLFHITGYKSLTFQETRSGKNQILLVHPDELVDKGVRPKPDQAAHPSFATLDPVTGAAREGTVLHEGDMITSRVVYNVTMKKPSAESLFKDPIKVESYMFAPEIADKTLSGTVDRVIQFASEDGERTTKMRLRKWRVPVLGDKLASRHAQKGVIGMVVPQEQMPFTRDGVVPDIIINPHAFPTRMVMAHMLETLFSKLGCQLGARVDVTAFGGQSVETAAAALEAMGLSRYGDEILYNGVTGEQMPMEIFMGPIYYQRLKQMVADKVNYRATGPRGNTTHQPVKGRARGGGLRVGEMETNVLIAHGFGSFIKESMMERSDRYSMFVDGEAGQPLVAGNATKGIFKTRPDETARDIRRVDVPYCWNVLMHELTGLAVETRLITRPAAATTGADADDEELAVDPYEIVDVDEPVEDGEEAADE